MRIGIIKTGSPPKHLSSRFGGYPTMIARALGDQNSYETFDAEHGELPQAGIGVDAFVISGSSASVTDGLGWAIALENWLRANEKPIAGLCFGHQVMASAFGGHVERSSKGWGWGLHRYDLLCRRDWIDAAATEITLPAAHEDQVVKLGPTGRVLAGSGFCPIAIVDYTDRPAISVQAHPEFSLDFERALIERRVKYGLMSPAEAAPALATLATPSDAELFSGWINAFLTGTSGIQ